MKKYFFLLFLAASTAQEEQDLSAHLNQTYYHFK